MINRRRMRFAPVAVALGLVAAACSSPAEETADVTDAAHTSDATSAATTANDDTTSAGTAADGSANDQGSSATASPSSSAAEPADPDAVASGEEVTVVMLWPDLTFLADIGFAEDPGDIAPFTQALVDDLNAAGGLAGHPVNLEMVQWDILAEGDNIRSCVTATEDLDAFVVLGYGGVFGDQATCIAEQQSTLLITDDGFPDAFYSGSGGRLLSLSPSKERAMENVAAVFADELSTKTVAVVSDSGGAGDREAVEKALLPALEAAGVEVEVDVVLDADLDVAAGQIPVEVAAMRDAGVDAVIAGTGFVAASTLATAMAQAGLDDVSWYGGDLGGFVGDLYASQMPPGQFDGARGVTFRTTGETEPRPGDLACLERIETAAGATFGIESVEFAGGQTVCNLMDLLTIGAERLDGALSPTALADAIRSIDDVELADHAPTGFPAGRSDLGLQTRIVEYQADCACWVPVDDFQPAAV